MASPVNILLIEDGDLFVAQCLEYDIAAQGRSKEEVLKRFRAAFKAEMAEAKERGVEIGPAPKLFHAIYKANSIGREKMRLVA